MVANGLLAHGSCNPRAARPLRPAHFSSGSGIFVSSPASSEWSGFSSMGVELTSQSVSIVPDQGFLADKATTYPVYLDPDSAKLLPRK